MKTKKAVSVLLMIAVLAAVCFAEQKEQGGKVDLKLRLKAGESHEMKMTQTQDITQTIMGQEQKMKQTQEMVMGMDVLSVDANGNMDIEMTYKSMKTSIEGPMGKMEFDTANTKPADPNRPEQQMIAGIFSAIAGSEFQMKISPTGKTSDIRGLDVMLAKMKEKMGDNPAMAGMEQLFDKMFDEKQIKNITGDMMGSFPTEPVAVGDSWYSITSVSFIVPVDIDTTYMLKERKGGIAYIDAVSKMDMGDSSKAIEIDPNNKVSMQLSGTMNASSEIDEKTGLTRKSTIAMNFTGIMKMEANPQMPEGIAMPMTVKGEGVVELIK